MVLQHSESSLKRSSIRPSSLSCAGIELMPEFITYFHGQTMQHKQPNEYNQAISRFEEGGGGNAHLDSSEVEVVGGLIQHEHVRSAHQH